MTCLIPFNEDALGREIIRVWGEHGAHAEVYGMLRAQVKALTAERDEAQDTLRRLASWLGNGGFNAPTVDAKEFESKIRDGIDAIIKVEVNRALSDADTRAHAWWAHTGPHKSLREAIHNGQPSWTRAALKLGDPE